MSDDQLERALNQLQQETVDTATFEAARARVWNRIAQNEADPCAEFRPELPAHLAGTLTDARRALIADHLGRCTACRAALAELRGNRVVVPMPQRAASRWRRPALLAAAAALVIGVLYTSRGTLDALMAPGGPRATVAAIDGEAFRLTGEPLGVNDTIAEGEVIRTSAGAHAVLRLADGSTVDVNERTELSATAVWSGMSVHVKRGDVIVQAARQRRGHLCVVTRDSIASVKGTVFAVSSGLGGSVVSVVEGSVAVRQPGTEVLLGPGQQAASNPALAMSVERAVAWSPEAERYVALLATLSTIDRELAQRLPLQQRTSSPLLPYLPAGAYAYGSIPNMSGRLNVALQLADQQASTNPTFGAWWTSEAGATVRRMLYRLQSVSGMLGDEVVFAASAARTAHIPMVIARVAPGMRASLAQALDEIAAEAGEPLPHALTDELLLVSSSPTNVSWAWGNLGRAAGSPFAAAIGRRYQRGAFAMFGVDVATVVTSAPTADTPPLWLAQTLGTKYVFFEQRAPAGAEENEVTLQFDGERKGLASWLAEAGSGGAAEYLSVDALVAGYASVRQPSQLLQEFLGLMKQFGGNAATGLPELEQRLGAGFAASVASALGSEAAFAINGLSLTGPRWLLTTMVYNQAFLDDAVRRVVETANQEMATAGESPRLTITQEHVGGRTWTTVSGAGLPVDLTWTYDGGYIVMASDRGTAEHAIATRNGGAALVWSQAFRDRLPASSGLHPSAFVWVNTRGALSTLATMTSNPVTAALLAERDPVLVVFDVKPDQIHGASRTRLTTAILDIMTFTGSTDDAELVTASPAS